MCVKIFCFFKKNECVLMYYIWDNNDFIIIKKVKKKFYLLFFVFEYLLILINKILNIVSRMVVLFNILLIVG